MNNYCIALTKDTVLTAVGNTCKLPHENWRKYNVTVIASINMGSVTGLVA